MSMTFVNLHGQPVAVPPPGAVPAKKPPRPRPDTYHKGWVVIGFSPERIEEARAKAPDSFELDSFMRTSKPAKASKPYAIHSSAEQHAEGLRKLGWRLVQVVPMAKGGKA